MQSQPVRPDHRDVGILFISRFVQLRLICLTVKCWYCCNVSRSQTCPCRDADIPRSHSTVRQVWRSGLRLTLRGTKSLAETQLGIYFEDIFQSSAMNIFNKSRPVERLKIENTKTTTLFPDLVNVNVSLRVFKNILAPESLSVRKLFL